MKKLWMTLAVVVTFFGLTAVSAGAVVNETVKVGLRYASSAMFSANLENAVGRGYEFGYYDSDRNFEALGWTGETAISMTAAGTVYLSGGAYSGTPPSGNAQTIGKWHIQLDGEYRNFDRAADEAAGYDGGYPAYLSGGFYVRVGSYDSRSQAEDAMEDLGVSGEAVASSSSGVLVTATRTTEILFEFDCQGALSLGVLPDGQGDEAVTWFRGYKYKGGFEYPRVTGGDLNVVNVLNVEEYVKGAVPYEMTPTWSQAALEAQAVCARTYAYRTTKHLASYGFDLCSGSDCQVYYGAGNGSTYPTSASDAAVDDTAGLCMYYDGELVNAVYSSSNGGASEDAENVWGSPVGYLIGKKDPYESTISIPNYSYSTTYTAAELTWILQQKGYTIGTVKDVYVSEFTPLGNVYKVAFVDTAGKTVTVKGETCRTIFYSSTYNKSVRSMRFTISGGSGGGGLYYVNGGSNTMGSLEGKSVISGDGTVSKVDGGGLYAITSSGTAALGGKTSGPAASGGTFTITGTGNGHNVGFSQYGAKAMAEQGHDFEEILQFYYTDITIG